MSNKMKQGVAAIVAVVVAGFFFLPNFTKNNNALNTQTPVPTTQENTAAVSATNGLLVQDEVAGTGATAQAGDVVSVNYTGKLQNGTVFDSSVGKQPFQFILGKGQVIAGWEQGLVGMKVGGKRVLVIPSALAYGAQEMKDSTGKVVIPANATLMFEVELLKVTPAAQAAPTPEGQAAQ